MKEVRLLVQEKVVGNYEYFVEFVYVDDNKGFVIEFDGDGNPVDVCFATRSEEDIEMFLKMESYITHFPPFKKGMYVL